MTTARATWRSPQAIALLAVAGVGVLWLAQGRVLRGGVVVLAAAALLLFVRAPSRKYAIFALITVALATVVPLSLAAALDLYLHQRYATSGGYNVWGYRGEAVGAKAAGERRIAVLGGSAAFGYGVKTDETFPWYVGEVLDQAERQAGHGPVRVINLAWNGEGAYAFRTTVEDYDYLSPDAVVLYSGYNDLAPNTRNFRRQSPIFRVSGYMPILPVLPINGWLRIRDLSDTREQDRVVFQPNLADRSATQAADMALQITKAVERQLDRLAQEGDLRDTPRTGTNCGRWEHYCQSVHAAVQAALERGHHAVVVTEPYVGGGGRAASLHINQQSTLLAMLASRFAGEPRLHYVNMGHAVDLTDTSLCYDGLHLTPKGNRQLAEQLAPALAPVLDSLGKQWPAAPVRLFDARPEFDVLAGSGQLRAARAAAGKPSAPLAIAEWAAGDTSRAMDTIESALAAERRPDTIWTAALLFAMNGDSAAATPLVEEFANTAPSSLDVERLWLPVLRAALDHAVGQNDRALRQLDRTIAFDRESYWPRYLRGIIDLKQKRGFEAEEEFVRILAQPELNAHDPLYVTSRRHLATARVQQGAAVLYGETYQAFFAAWKSADAGLPLLETAKAEYIELRKSVSMPPPPF